ETVRVVGERGRKDLDRDIPAEPRIPGPVYLSHAPGADGRDDLVGAQPGTCGKSQDDVILIDGGAWLRPRKASEKRPRVRVERTGTTGCGKLRRWPRPSPQIPAEPLEERQEPPAPKPRRPGSES